MMSFCRELHENTKGMSVTRRPPHVDVGSKELTCSSRSVTINPIEGDKEFPLEIQPHLNAGLWPVYLEMSDMRFVPPPVEREKREAPGNANAPAQPVVPPE